MFPTDDEVEDLLHHMDTDGGGGVSLQVGIAKLLSVALWVLVAKVFVKLFIIDSQEFLTQMGNELELRKEVDPEHDFKEAFRVFDKDGKLVATSSLICLSNVYTPSGKVDSEELRRVLTECGRMKLTPEEAEEFIGNLGFILKPCPGMMDSDGDGMLDYEEFVVLFTEKIGI